MTMRKLWIKYIMEATQLRQRSIRIVVPASNQMQSNTKIPLPIHDKFAGICFSIPNTQANSITYLAYHVSVMWVHVVF